MADDDYEIVSKKEIKNMKEEIDKLKKNPLGQNASSGDLMGAIDSLTVSLRDLMDMFKEASKDMKEEDSNQGSRETQLLHEKLDALIEQNKKIAKGIVTVADMLNKPEEKKEEKPKAPANPFDMPNFDNPFGGPPPPMGPPGAPPGPPPPPGFGPMPPPPSMPESGKKGLFHRR